MDNLCNLKDWILFINVHKYPGVKLYDEHSDTIASNIDFLKLLNDYVDIIYAKYVSKYPEVERSTFHQKSIEAKKVIEDNEIPMSETPYLAELTYGDLKERLRLAKSIMKKVSYMAKLEKYSIIYRKVLKKIIDKCAQSKPCNIVKRIREEGICFDFNKWRQMNINDVLKRGRL